MAVAASLGNLPPPLVHRLLNDIAANAATIDEAAALLCVSRGWYAHVSCSEVWVNLYSFLAQNLRSNTIRHLSQGSSGNLFRFLTNWAGLGSQSFVRALDGASPADVAASEEFGELHLSDGPEDEGAGPRIACAKGYYQQLLTTSAVVEKVLVGVKALVKTKQALSGEHWAVSCTIMVTVFLLAPQAVFWLSMRVDGMSACPWLVGSSLGLVACAVWMPQIAWRIAIVLNFVRRQRAVLELIRKGSGAGCPVDKNAVPTPLILDTKIALHWIIRPVYWACFIWPVSAWLALLLVTRGWLLLAAGAALNCIPLCCCAALIVLCRALGDSHDNQFLYSSLGIHCIIGWLVTFQALAGHVTCAPDARICRPRQLLACASLLLPLAVCYWLAGGWLVRAVRRYCQSRRGRCPEASELGGALLVVLSVLAVHVFLLTMLGRSLRDPLALRVPLVAFTSPMQLPTLLLVPAAFEFLKDHRDAIRRGLHAANPGRVCRKRSRAQPHPGLDAAERGVGDEGAAVAAGASTALGIQWISV